MQNQINITPSISPSAQGAGQAGVAGAGSFRESGPENSDTERPASGFATALKDANRESDAPDRARDPDPARAAQRSEADAVSDGEQAAGGDEVQELPGDVQELPPDEAADARESAAELAAEMALGTALPDTAARVAGVVGIGAQVGRAVEGLDAQAALGAQAAQSRAQLQATAVPAASIAGEAKGPIAADSSSYSAADSEMIEAAGQQDLLPELQSGSDELPGMRLESSSRSTVANTSLPGVQTAALAGAGAASGNGLAPNAAAPDGASSPVQQFPLHPDLQSARWGGAVGERLVWLARNGDSQAELTLNPPSLGRLSVQLTLDGDSASVHFTSAHLAVRDALESAAPRLREMLAENGFNLVNVDVSQGQTQSGGGFADGEGDGAGQGARGEADAIDAAEEAVNVQAVPTGMVDAYI